MPLSGAGAPARSKAINGGYVESDDMSKLYRIRYNEECAKSVHDAIDAMEQLDEVEFAEPNYIVYTTSSEVTDCDHYQNEPLFNQQWAFNAINLKNVWTKKKITDKRPVIAILDTGVDITHPDLADNIWTNEREANGVEEADDDANGYADDVHGWDFVNQTPRIGDWNGHGTHVAGIAAAVGKNGIGITGANPDALIMPVTIMQSDGTGDVATIIKGIDYAAANGADIINMSFGGYSYSIAEEQALARAYSKAVLVAAAGNDCRPINTVKCEVCKQYGSPMFPAAFTFVLGVESSDSNGNRASFSNYDDDGATFSSFGEEKLYNYELRAPGVAIMSTFPGGKYKALNGTSMASPLVAGAISRLLQCKDYSNKELLFGDLIHARKKNSNGIVDFLAAYNITDEDRIPELQLVTYALVDSVDGDGDTENNTNIIPDAPTYTFKVSSDSVEYWYNIKSTAYSTSSIMTANVEGEFVYLKEKETGNEGQSWKIVVNESNKYTIINKLGYALCCNEIDKDTVKVCKIDDLKDVNQFYIGPANGYVDRYNIFTTHFSFSGNPIKLYEHRYANDYYFIPLFEDDEDNEDNEEITVDSVGGDGDNRPDAGEVIELWPTLRNEWGVANNITFSLAVDEAEDPTTVEFLNNNVSFGKSLGSYAKGCSDNPLRIKINENCVDGRKIRLVLRATCDNIAAELVHRFTITVENGVEIGGIIIENTTLYPNVHYIVTKKILIPQGVTLTIKPGTVLKFKDQTGITNSGTIDCVGKPDSMIVFRPADLLSRVGVEFKDLTLKYTKIEELCSNSTSSMLYDCNLENCAVLYCTTHPSYGSSSASLSWITNNHCNIKNTNLFYNNTHSLNQNRNVENDIEYLNIFIISGKI